MDRPLEQHGGRPTIVFGRSIEHWVVLATVFGGLATLVAVGLLTTPAEAGHGTHEQFGLPPCNWIVDWGIPCPGCGVTTSVSLFAHGRLVDALVNQPFGFALALGAALLPLPTGVAHVAGHDLRATLKRLPWVWLAVGAAVLFAAAWAWKLATHGPGAA